MQTLILANECGRPGRPHRVRRMLRAEARRAHPLPSVARPQRRDASVPFVLGHALTAAARMQMALRRFVALGRRHLEAGRRAAWDGLKHANRELRDQVVREFPVLNFDPADGDAFEFDAPDDDDDRKGTNRGGDPGAAPSPSAVGGDID